MKSKRLILIFTAVLVVALGFTAFFVLKPDSGMSNFKEYTFVGKSQTAVEFSDEFTKCFTVGDYALFIHKDTSALAFVSSDGKSVFNSFSSSAAENNLAAFLNVTLRDEAGNSYELNSTHNSAAFGGFSVAEQKSDYVKLVFELYKDKNSFNQKSGVSATVPVEITPDGDGFNVNINMSEVNCPQGICIEKISILPGFFTVSKPTQREMYIVPDGSGASIALGDMISDAYTLDLPVYGSDVAFSQYTAGANLPAFAYRNQKTLLASVINDGDALSSVTVNRFSGQGGSLYNTFTVTPFGNVDGAYVKGESYSGSISQSFIVAGDGKGDYNEFAVVLRENLIERGYIPAKTDSTFTDFPFFITAPASTDGTKDNIYTTFENSSEMIALLKSRGVRSVALRLSGIGDDGFNTSALKNSTFSSYIGDKTDYKSLCESAKKNNGTVWIDTDFATGEATVKAKGVDKYADLRKYLSTDSLESEILNYNSVYKNISSVYSLLTEVEEGSVCVNDLSFLLYTDVDGGINRQEALQSLRDKMSSLSIGGGLMLTKPAVYLMSNAQAVVEMPQNAQCEAYPGVQSVPLLQMVLHGSIYYGTQPVNLNVDGLDYILKAVETGSVPSFVFTHSGNELLNYGPYAAQVSKYYSLVKKMLPLTDMEITSHELVVSGVYKITYDYNKVVYVNYNPSVVEVNGVLVSAKDFIVI